MLINIHYEEASNLIGELSKYVPEQEYLEKFRDRVSRVCSNLDHPHKIPMESDIKVNITS